MAVLVDEHTRLAVAGMTGREGSFHTLNNRRYGTTVVAGVTPGKGGQELEGIPVYDTWAQAAQEARPNAAMIFVPPPFAAGSILEAAASGVDLVVAITEGIPMQDELRVYNVLRREHPATRLVGPNCPGILSPGKANVGIIPAAFFKEGNVGVVSRSGTLTYQIGNEIAQAGFGCSTIVGIGGDPVPGSSFVDVLELFQADEETELIVMAGEIGGSAEEEAAEYIAAHVTKPVVAYIAGFTAPAGKQMGHAGAIVSGTGGTAAAKARALEEKGVHVGRTPTEVAQIAVEVLGSNTIAAR
jgi:succinyl-CoA synthetase alpha subunit